MSNGCQARLTQLVREKRAAAQRLAADVVVAADRLSVVSGVSPTPDIGKGEVDRMNAALGKAAGVVVVSEAVGKAWRHRGGLATGWPVLAWVAKFKPDPLRRLHLDRIPGGRKGGNEAGAIEADPPGRTSLPATTGIQRAGVDAAVRAFADQASSGLSRGWADAIKAAARSETAVLPDQLDGAIAGTDLDLDRHRGWWQLVRVLQWVFVVAVLAGLGWLASAFVLAFMQLPPLPKVTWWGLPGTDRAAGRWRAGWPADRRTGPDRSRGGRPSPGAGGRQGAPPLDRRSHPRAGGRAGQGRAGPLRAGPRRARACPRLTHLTHPAELSPPQVHLCLPEKWSRTTATRR